MSAKETLTSLLERNNATSKSWPAMPTIDQMRGMMGDRKATIIVTCADPRADPSSYIGLKPGEFPIIRNAGGRVTEDVLSSIELMSLVVPLGMLVVIHHTNCGALELSDDEVRSGLADRSPEHKAAIQHKHWNSFHDIGMDQSIREDVTKLKAWPFLPKGTPVSGYVFDIGSGQLREVEAANFSG